MTESTTRRPTAVIERSRDVTAPERPADMTKPAERRRDMTKLERRVNVAAVLLPFLAFLLAAVLFWNHGLDVFDLTLMAGLYLFSALGITIGYHRHLTHRAFDTHRWFSRLLAAAGSMAVQGPVIDWVADHRKHHAHTDRDGDPHSPHTGDGHGLRGLWHAHVGWLWTEQGRARSSQYARDLVEDPWMRAINKAFPAFVLLGLLVAFVAGLAVKGTVSGGLESLLWAGVVRVFFLHHVTWSINSICHFFGRRRFDTDDKSTNVFWLALPSMGESWHHNHHAFPRAAAHGLRWWEIDVSGLIIRAMKRVGLVWNVVLITPERAAERASAAAATR